MCVPFEIHNKNNYPAQQQKKDIISIQETKK